MQDFKKLAVWKDSIDIVKDVYSLCSQMPKEELYGLTAQIKRASSSIPANKTEGAGKKSGKDFFRYLFIAIGSTSELESHLLLAVELGFFTKDKLKVLLDNIDHSRRKIYNL